MKKLLYISFLVPTVLLSSSVELQKALPPVIKKTESSESLHNTYSLFCSKGMAFTYKRLFDEIRTLTQAGLSLVDAEIVSPWIDAFADYYTFSEEERALIAASKKGDLAEVSQYAPSARTVIKDLALYLAILYHHDQCATCLCAQLPGECLATLDEFAYRVPLLATQLEVAVPQGSNVASLLRKRLESVSGPRGLNKLKEELLGALMSNCFVSVETRDAFEMVLSGKVFDNQPTEEVREWLLACFASDHSGIKNMQWYQADCAEHFFALHLVLSRLIVQGNLDLLKLLAGHLCARQLLVFQHEYKQLARQTDQVAVVAYLENLSF